MEDEQLEKLAKEEYPETWYQDIDGDWIDSKENGRQAFKHGLLLGYNLAMKELLKDLKS